MVELLVGDRTWLLVGEMTPEAQKKLAATGTFKPAQVLWWSGKTLTAELLSAVGPRVAIASANEIDPETAAQLRQSQTQIFWTGRDGPSSGRQQRDLRPLWNLKKIKLLFFDILPAVNGRGF